MNAELDVEYERLRLLLLSLPPCREISLAITNLQQSKLWVYEGIKVTSEQKEGKI